MKTLLRSRLLTTTLAIALAFAASSANGGKLGAVREAVRSESKEDSGKKEKDRKNDRNRRGRGHRDCGDGDSFNWISIFVSDAPATSTTASQTYSSNPTNQQAVTAQSISTTLDQYHWGNRFTGFAGDDSETLKHGAFQWLAQSPGSLGLDVSGTRFEETVGSIKDRLWVGDANIVYEPIVGAVRGRLGVGVNWLHDSAGFDMGTNFTAGFDWTMMDFLITTAEVDFGSIGEASLFHGQVTVGMQLGPTELFAGYNKYDLGGVELDGTIFGMRLRF